MTRRSVTSCLTGLLLLAAACSRRERQAQGRVDDPYIADLGSVTFEIEPVQGGNGASQWMASYRSQGKTARFRIELGIAKAFEAKESKDLGIKSGQGRFVAESGSDALVLLANLKKVLEAKTLPIKVQRSTNLPFTFVSFGEHLSQSSGGGFNAKPADDWTSMKLFIAEGKEEGEVFLNLNPVIRKGQFSIKDSEYGDFVLAQLAKVL